MAMPKEKIKELNIILEDREEDKNTRSGSFLWKWLEVKMKRGKKKKKNRLARYVSIIWIYNQYDFHSISK